MVNIFVIGRHGDYTMDYHILLEREDGYRYRICGTLNGSKPETEVCAVGVAVRYAYEKRLDATIFTDLENPVDWIGGKYKPTAQRTKEFVKYVEKAKKEISLEFVMGIPENKYSTFSYIVDAYEEKGKTPATTDLIPANPFKDERGKPSIMSGWRATMHAFRLTVYRIDGKCVIDYDDNRFFGNLADAVYLANWYESKSTDKNSEFYRCKVERYNIPKELNYGKRAT